MGDFLCLFLGSEGKWTVYSGAMRRGHKKKHHWEKTSFLQRASFFYNFLKQKSFGGGIVPEKTKENENGSDPAESSAAGPEKSILRRGKIF